MSYDWELDAKLSWLEAIREIRRRGVESGKYQATEREQKRMEKEAEANK